MPRALSELFMLKNKYKIKRVVKKAMKKAVKIAAHAKSVKLTHKVLKAAKNAPVKNATATVKKVIVKHKYIKDAIYYLFK